LASAVEREKLKTGVLLGVPTLVVKRGDRLPDVKFVTNPVNGLGIEKPFNVPITRLLAGFNAVRTPVNVLVPSTERLPVRCRLVNVPTVPKMLSKYPAAYSRPDCPTLNT